MTTLWDSYLPEVLPEVPDCPQPMAINAIRNAAIEFCERTWIVKYDLTPDTALVAGTPAYVLTPPTETVIATIPKNAMGFFAAGATNTSPVTGPVSENELDNLRPGWREDVSQGNANTVDFFTLEKNTIRIVPIPVVNQAAALRISLILKPTRASTGGSDVLFDDWLEAIAHGAKYRLMVEPGKEWTNIELAAYCKNEFNKGVGNATAKRLQGGGDRPLQTWPRRFGRP